MRMVAPRTGAPEVTIAEDQTAYSPLVAARYDDGVLLTRWRMNEADRAKVAAGEDLYIAVMTFGGPIQPMSVQIGDDGWRDPTGERSET
jgi:hypothetical protein